MAGSTLGREFDIARILQRHTEQINELQKRASGGGSMFAISTPRWRTRLSADASIANNTVTNVSYSTTASAPEHDPGTPAFATFQTVLGEPRIVFDQAGLYLIRAAVQWNSAANGTRKLLLYRNATTEPFSSVEYANAGAGAGIHQEVVLILPFNASDYLKIAFFQTSGGNLTALADGAADRAGSWVSIVPLGAYAVT